MTPPDVPLFLDADPTRMTPVISNLLDNAARYAPPRGRIGLTAECRGRDVVIAVKDDGIGIPPEMLGRIFEMFAQVDDALERASGGLGIGLSLVKGLVEMHGGSVGARGAGPGRGSEFIVRLPLPVEPLAGDHAPA